LVTLEAFKKNFPRVPGVILPESFYQPYRLDPGPRWQREGIADMVPPKTGPKFVCLVPQVDEDGQELAGIRLPEIAATLATYTGWSMREPSFSNSLRRNAGAVWPLTRTAAERRQNEDPRKSILERYPTKRDYLLEFSKSLLNLKTRRLLLDEDVRMLLMEAAQATYWPGISTVRIKKVAAQPTELEAGDSLLLSVDFEGSKKNVLIALAKFREATDLKYSLNDDGINGDEKAGDQVWSSLIQVPSYAPKGQFHFDILALDKDLNGIYLPGTMNDEKREQGSLVFSVK
jgi:hypothetical protein